MMSVAAWLSRKRMRFLGYEWAKAATACGSGRCWPATSARVSRILAESSRRVNRPMPGRSQSVQPK